MTENNTLTDEEVIEQLKPLHVAGCIFAYTDCAEYHRLMGEKYPPDSAFKLMHMRTEKFIRQRIIDIEKAI